MAVWSVAVMRRTWCLRPVVAAAVILPPTFYHPLLFDSKQLSEHQRDTLRPIIEEAALAWGVGDRLSSGNR